MSQPEVPVFYTLKEVAEILKVHVRSVERAVARGQLKSVRIGRFVRVPAAVVKKMGAA